MPFLKRFAFIGLTATAVLGCDAGSNPDNQVRDKVAQARAEAATGDEAGRQKAKSILEEAASPSSSASDASIAQAKAALGQVEYETGLEALREADKSDLQASEIVLQMVAVGSQLKTSQTLVQSYSKLEPAPAKLDIEKKITQAKGSPDQPKWSADVDLNLWSLGAVEQEVSRLQGEIAKWKTQIAELDKQRISLLTEAEASMKEADGPSSRASVDAFKKASESRKKAADVQTEIELIKGRLAPLEKDLALAQGQQQIVLSAISELEDESKALDAGWKGVQSKIELQVALINQIATAPDTGAKPGASHSAAGKSIAVKATALAEALKNADASRATAEASLSDAAKHFKDATDKANLAGSAMTLMADKHTELASVISLSQAVLSPQVFMLQQANAEKALAELNMSKAAGLSARLKLRDVLGPWLKQAGLGLPKEIADTTLEKSFRESVAEATSHFQQAADPLLNIHDVPARNNTVHASTQKAGAITLIFVRYGQYQLALLKGQPGKTEHTAALEAVKAAAELQVSFPTLPGDLASAIPAPPPPPAPPTSTSAPSGDTSAPTEGAPAAPAEPTTPPA